MGVLWKELISLYECFATGRPSPLAELPIQYPDFALWQRRHLDANEMERQLTYWRRRLAGLPTLELPTDRQRPAVSRYRGATMRVVLPRHLSNAVRRLARTEKVTLFATLMTGTNV